MTDFQERVAIVTGGARGIGAATARHFSERGASVAILDLSEEEASRTAAALPRPALGVACNVTEADSVDAAVARVVEEFGRIDILVNNAGVTRDASLFKLEESDWDLVINVHLKGAFLMSRAVQSHMVSAKYGRIISMSSLAALGNRGQANYSAAKAGLQGLTKTIAAELGRFGITANAVAPGFVVTDMTDETARRLGVTPEEFREDAAKTTATRRVGRPEDIANAIAFFASEASAFISGQVLYVDGGSRIS